MGTCRPLYAINPQANTTPAYCTQGLSQKLSKTVMYILPEGLKGYIWKFRFPSLFIYKGVVLKFNLINNENRKLIVLWQQSLVLLPRAQQTVWALPLKPKSICMVEAAVCKVLQMNMVWYAGYNVGYICTPQLNVLFKFRFKWFVNCKLKTDACMWGNVDQLGE